MMMKMEVRFKTLRKTKLAKKKDLWKGNSILSANFVF
jgi:hypothetical protein